MTGVQLVAVYASAVIGTATNDSAAAGKLGEYIASIIPVGTPVALSNTTPANITSISLTAGDWDVTGTADFTASVSATLLVGGISTTTGTFLTDETQASLQISLGASTDRLALPTVRISIAATTTVYLVARSDFAAGAVSAWGSIRARRMR